MMEVLCWAGPEGKAKRDARYAQLKRPAQGTRGLVKFSEVELLTPAMFERKRRARMFSSVIVNRKVYIKATYRTIWCIAWSS